MTGGSAVRMAAKALSSAAIARAFMPPMLRRPGSHRVRSRYATGSRLVGFRSEWRNRQTRQLEVLVPAQGVRVQIPVRTPSGGAPPEAA